MKNIVSGVNATKQAKELFSNRKALFSMFSAIFNGSYRMSSSTTIALCLGLAYILLPLDFDWIPFIGWIDDGFVGYWVFKKLVQEAGRFTRLKNGS